MRGRCSEQGKVHKDEQQPAKTDMGLHFLTCDCDAQMPGSTSSNYSLSYQIGGTAYVVFTRVVELSAKVEFWPSSRSGGRAGLPDNAMVTPTGRAFNPVAVSSHFSNDFGTVPIYH